jgi:hypothetical protein
LKSAGSSHVKDGVTNGKGIAIFENIHHGSYGMKNSFVGLQDYLTNEFSFNGVDINFGVIL